MAEETHSGEVVMHTENPVHECNFKWIIENVSKFSRRLRNSFPVDCECKPEFQIVAKFHERFQEVIHVNIGVQRSDGGNKLVYVNADISLQNIEEVVYRQTNFTFTSSAGESPHYCFSDIFAAPSKRWTVPTSYSNESKGLTDLEKKGVVASYQDCDNILLLPNDILVIKGVLKVYGCCVVTNQLKSNVPEDIPPQSHVEKLLWDIRGTYEDRLFTDVELKVGSESIHAHRYVLSLRSPVFRKMFEYDMKEKSDGVINIDDVDKTVLEALLWYFYTGIVKDLPWEEICELYVVADRYEVFSLKEACSSVLDRLLDKDTVCLVLGLSSVHNDEVLKAKAKDYIAKNFHNLKEMTEWEVLVKSNPGLAAEVVQDVTQRQLEKDNKQYVPNRYKNEVESTVVRHFVYSNNHI